MVGQIILLLISTLIVYEITKDICLVVRRHSEAEKKWRRMVAAATIEK